MLVLSDTIAIAGRLSGFDERLRRRTLRWEDDRFASVLAGVAGRFETDREHNARSFRVRRIGRRRGGGVIAHCELDSDATGDVLRVRIELPSGVALMLGGWTALITVALSALVVQELGKPSGTGWPPWVALPALPPVLAGLMMGGLRADAAKLKRFLESVCAAAK